MFDCGSKFEIQVLSFYVAKRIKCTFKLYLDFDVLVDICVVSHLYVPYSLT